MDIFCIFLIHWCFIANAALHLRLHPLYRRQLLRMLVVMRSLCCCRRRTIGPMERAVQRAAHLMQTADASTGRRSTP